MREREFGVWLLWQEIKDKYPSFEFRHGHGLGVLATGENVPAEVLDFLDMAKKDPVVISDFFSFLGNKISLQYKIQEQNARISEFMKSVQARDSQIAELNSAIQAKDTQITELSRVLQTKDTRIIELNKALEDIHQSFTWNMVNKFQKLVDRLLRPGTRRRRWYDSGIKGLRILANEGYKQ